MTLRKQIIEKYAEWTAYSGTRSGCPIKSREDVYPLIKTPLYQEILEGNQPISRTEFNEWHERNSISILKRNTKLNMGWATKLINLYLKTFVYTAQFGRPDLIKQIHPPIDKGLWDGILEQYKNHKHIISKTHHKERLTDIKTYEDYRMIMDGMELIAEKEHCLLIEVEHLWKGTDYTEGNSQETPIYNHPIWLKNELRRNALTPFT